MIDSHVEYNHGPYDGLCLVQLCVCGCVRERGRVQSVEERDTQRRVLKDMGMEKRC